jgi:UDP-galactopyranose mutase
MKPDLIVFSHLRWNFVYQRPQHLLSRLARRYNVYFFEEPVRSSGRARLELSEPAPNVTVCRPHTPNKAVGFHDDQLPDLKRLLLELAEERGLAGGIVWFYSPMALPLAQQLVPSVIVYDCMDELSAFMNAPKQLQQRESALLKAADLVFTGGPSLYRAKRERHAAVHCFPSSVDREHFAQALDGRGDHPEQRHLPRPRLGYFGVVDERIDIDIVAALADSHPEWQLPVVGPVVKIDAASLPRRPNIHYFGQREYGELPKFVAGWDVCLLPFARNEATRYISPTKTLEYMAADKAIVSTPITDVVEPYGEIVSIADRAGFTAACERALAMPPHERQSRRSAAHEMLARTSWDLTAERMSALVDAAHESKARSAPRTLPAVLRPTPERKPAAAGNKRESYRNVVIGAGPTGLSAAYHLGKGSLLLERNSTVGGWCRSIEDGGYTFDYAGHIMFSNDPYVHEMYARLLGDNVHWQDREAWIYSKGVHTRYPFQGSLYGLPPEVLKECIVGAIEARYGKLSSDSPAVAAPGKAAAITDCCADGSVASGATVVPQGRSVAHRDEPQNFEEFIYRVWGAGVAKHFAIPYNRKLWAVPLAEMETSWLGGRVPLPNLEEMIDGALRPKPKPAGPNARFGYPLRGGFQALMNGFLPLLEGELKLGAEVVAVDPVRHEITLDDGAVYGYEDLISTMPLPVLVALLGNAAPERVRRAASKLRHVSVRCVNLGVAREKLTDKHWIYYPEDTVFHRIFVQGNASPHCNPAGGFGLTCEITYSPSKPLPCEGQDLVDLCIADCIRVGLFRPEDRVAVANEVDMPYAYVVYDHVRKQSVDVIRRWLSTQDVHLAGRYSEWEYYNSDHAFIAGKKVAEAVLSAKRAAATSDAG